MSALAGERSRRIELVCFAALASFASLRWTGLVADPPSGRVTFAVILATAAGAGLAALSGAGLPRRLRWTLAAAVTAAALILTLVIVGLPARLLLPAGWGELADNVARSLQGLGDVPVPYAGADVWTRLVIVLVPPFVVGLAALAAFWPGRRRAAGRIVALVLLTALYLVAVAWARPGRQLAGGLLLLVLISAWLWLPALRARRLGPALGALAISAAVALPAAALLDPARPLLDYRHWGLFTTNGLSFRWDQQYGPLDWPQRGTLVLEVASDRSHYWKATNLDRFDGVRWLRSSSPGPEPALGEPLKFHPKGAPPRPETEWVDRVNFRVRALTSDFAIGAGTTLAVQRIEARPSADGSWTATRELRRGDTYTALVYDPKPSPSALRAAGTRYPAEVRRYVSFTVPGPAGPGEVRPALWGRGRQSIGADLIGSPYEGMYELATRLASGAPSAYDAVDRIEHGLGAYDYRQDVPDHRYPLAAFLATDRAGYCQQFSGAMALMLRMLGIPSRVAAGFAPGGRNATLPSSLVDDTDAHNWVEVFFPRIGWVTFDPTPSAAPAATQLGEPALGVAKSTPPSGSEPPLVLNRVDPRDRARESKPSPTRRPALDRPGGGRGPIAIGAAVAGALVIASLLAYLYRRVRTARLADPELEAAELAELDRVLRRLGSPLPEAATLRTAEERLAELAGDRAAAYPAALRERRFRRPDRPPPTISERRGLRRDLLRATGLRSAVTLIRAIPPGGPRPGRAPPGPQPA